MTIQKHMNPVKKILILAANPKNTPQLRFDEEVREITEGLRGSKYRDQFEIHSEFAVRFKDIRRALLEHKPNIVHFIGHGDRNGLMVEDKLGVSVLFSSKAVSGLFKLFSDKVECVILSSCYSKHQAAAINKHINYVIGMRKKIKDKAAIEFAVGFYDALGAGESVEKAFEFGCNAIEFLDLPKHLIPVLKKKKNLENLNSEKGTLTKNLSVPFSSQPSPQSPRISPTTPQEEHIEIQVNAKDWRKVIVRIFILFIFLITVLAFIDKYFIGSSNNKLDKEVIKQLTKYLNSRHPGSQYTIDPAATIVKPLENNRYEITLKNTSFTTDLTRVVDVVYKYIWSEDNPYSELDTARMEEIVFIFGPEEKYLDLRSIKDLYIENKLKPKLSGFGGVELNKIRASVGKITYLDQDSTDSRSSETLEHLEVDLSGLTAKQDKISFLLDIEKIGKVDTGEEDANLSDYMMNKNAKQPNLKKALETGASVTDLNIQLGKVNVSMKKNGITLCDGILENASYLQFMKPDSGKFFKLGWGIRLKNLKLSIPGNKTLQLLSRVKDFRFEFSIKPLSEGAFLAFLDLMREIFSSRTLPDNTKMGKFTPLVMRFVFEIMQSKTHMHFVISPFKYHFGEMKVEADMKLYNVMAGPIVTITATLFKAADILNKLKEANIFSADALETISGIIEKYGVTHENGDVTFTYNMDIFQLKKIFLNLGRLLPPTTHNPSNLLKY